MKVQAPFVLSVAWMLFGLIAASPAAGLAGWFGICPPPPGFMFARQFEEPQVAPGKNPTTYRQTVQYFWTGGHAEGYKVTLARDPAFKDRYAPATLRAGPGKPEEVNVAGAFTGWLWKDEQGGEVRLVVPLDADKALLMDYEGERIHCKGLVKMARRFDLAAVAAALARPPRTHTDPRLEDFQALKKGTPYGDVMDWLGKFPTNTEKDRVGKDATGNEVLYWVLPDGSRVQVALTSGFGSVVYVKRRTRDGVEEDLVK